MVHIEDCKRAIVSFVDMEIIPKCPSDKKIWYIGMGILTPKLVDKYVNQYSEILEMADILCADNMINIDEAESFFSQILVKSDGYTIMGVKMNAEDVHKIADIARRL